MYKSTAVGLVILFMLLDQSNAIQCYRCTVAPTNRHENRSQQLCLHFSESDEYVVDCPYSTMCMKEIYKYQLMSGEVIETVSRNCANQKHKEQVFKNRAWHEESTVEEPYEAGCVTGKDAKNDYGTTYCHCTGSLCNSATKESTSYHTDAMAVIFVFNAMKYLRSVD
ncbi:hypothetical protein Bhyg_15036 [Pseudolycoriella hygida]|uniref:Protein sleepless n=1 Tax=Pseudolycoriella hygida TaxID=35572 RepID=A0A9Q0RXV2_9DIPT|nr:hypothetical protein Bhyg_15036 [Pseudolycoriella hygida]